ncbi:PREDICTED: putative pentatricopeptide repeat-containing protein At1g13630 [Prunus mume]|uniref:Pentatricopeptide repeat-containing protein At1g13630 n=1 Tax=Prunus mume TaxID=102107 RepID=A0ABM1LXQ9_PRUMU|nr:PREDICTED: putative pentatricopeptide repeat-containing protein At1g13630 [Prunus mume]
MHELGLASRKPFKKCARVVGEVLGKFHPHGDTAVYDSLIVAWFLRLGPGSAPSLCELLLNRFRDWDSSGVVWDMLAFAYSRSEMIHDALSVIVKMKDLNLNISTPTYNCLLHNLKHTDIMWIVYNEVKDRGTHQSDHTFDILIDGLCEQSGLQDAVSFFMGVENTESWPSVVSFNTIMSRFCKLGFVDVAKSFFCLMFKCGLLPDSYSYNILIHGQCIAGSLEEALEFTKDMERHGVQPDTVTYNILCKGFHLLGLMSGAHEVIQKMLIKGLISPDHVTYTILICGHCHAGNIEEALKLQEEMLSRGFQLSVSIYSVLLRSLCKSGRVVEALRLLYEMEAVGLEPDLITYSILIHGLC